MILLKRYLLLIEYDSYSCIIGGAALARLHIGKSTYLEERTKHFSIQTMFTVLGTITGTGALVSLSPIGEGKVKLSPDSSFHFDMYSTSG